MALFRRNKTYWSDFSTDGKRYRLSLDTTDWREALSKEKEKIAEAQDGRLQVGKASWSRTAFYEAADRFMAPRAMQVRASTVATEGHQLKPLRAFFDRKPTGRITGDDVRAYQAHRHGQGRSNLTINHEVGLLRRILKRAGVWHRVSSDIGRGERLTLQVNKSVGKALTKEQKDNLLKVAATRPDWQVARCAAILALNTTMRACEIKGLYWRDVNWLDRIISVRSSKAEAGLRELPTNGAAWNVLRELHARAKLLGTDDPDSPVFATGPGRPVKSWRSAWVSLTAAAGISGFRFHDCRHHAITELAESQASDLTIMGIAGHVDREMLKLYSHVRMDAMRRALEALSAGDPAPAPTAQAAQAIPRPV